MTKTSTSMPDRDRKSEAGDDVYDVVVIGGAFSGAATALLLRRWAPHARVLIVERSERFSRKVGEATVEVSSMFLHRVLGLYDELSRHHLPKHGLRYWFHNDSECRLAEMSEQGPSGVPTLPAFQLDRARLDQRILELAVEEGCELERPAQVLDVDLRWPSSDVMIANEAGDERRVRARWVIDASGRRAFLARHLGLQETVPNHKVAAAWCRWDGVADLDGGDVLGHDPRDVAFPPLLASRRLATNHFCGYGYWCWMIPLAGGQTSLGVVYDKELFTLPGEGSPRDRYRQFVTTHPGMRELLGEAQMDASDFHTYVQLAYKTSQYMDRGWALVGDAAGFLDPFYSPGLDHAAISIYATLRLIEDDLRGDLDDTTLDARIATHNERFVRSYDRWLEALYIGKYELMGDAELLTCAALLDIAGYYLGVVYPAHKELEALQNPVFGLSIPQATYSFKTMRALNRRLRTLARARRKAGTYGRNNQNWRLYPEPFKLGAGTAKPLLQGLRIWLRLEREHLMARLRHGRFDVSRPVPAVSAR